MNLVVNRNEGMYLSAVKVNNYRQQMHILRQNVPAKKSIHQVCHSIDMTIHRNSLCPQFFNCRQLVCVDVCQTVLY